MTYMALGYLACCYFLVSSSLPHCTFHYIESCLHLGTLALIVPSV